MPRMLLASIFWLFTSLPLFAHELWIEPESFENESGVSVNAALINGQDFEGNSLAYATRSIVRLQMKSSEGLTDIDGLLGDRPAIKLKNAPDGLLVIGYESKASRLGYKTWEKFQSFATNKGFHNAEEAHREMGIEFENFDEGYTRFSKTLISQGHGIGQDSEFGFETELVAQKNPYTDDLSSGMPVLLLYQGAPKTNAMVQFFARDDSGNVSKTNLMTDTAGIVVLHTQAGHDYMLDAVTFRAPSEQLLERMDVDWETLWANLTFSVPD